MQTPNITLVKFRDRPRANIISNSAILMFSEMNSNNNPTTYSITYENFQAQIISAVASARQELVNSITSQQSELANQQNEIVVQQTNLNSAISMLNAHQTSIDNNNITLTNTQNLLSNTINMVQTQQANLNAQYILLSNTVNRLDSTITTVQSQANTLSVTVSMLSNTVLKVQNQDATISNTILTLQNQANTLSNTVNRLDSTILIVQQNANTISNTVSTLNIQQTLLANTVANLQLTNNTLNTAVSDIQSLLTRMQATEADLLTKVTALAGAPKQIIKIGNWTVNIASGGVALALGSKTYTKSDMTGIVAGDALIVVPTTATPAGFGVFAASATANNTVAISIFNPTLAIGASQNITLAIYALRTT